MIITDKPRYLYSDKSIRVWQARECDYNFIMQLCKAFRDFEFFYVPDNSIKTEIQKGNIIAFDYNVLEAGYIWVTFTRQGKSRINQLAVDADLWRNKVGSAVTSVYLSMAEKRNMWASYLSCNTNTPGHNFWPTVGYRVVCKKKAGKRGGENIIWGKLLKESDNFLFKPNISDIKTVESYINQSSISVSRKMKKDKAARAKEFKQGELF